MRQYSNIRSAWAVLAWAACFVGTSRGAIVAISHPDAAYVAGTTLLAFDAPDFDVVQLLEGGGVTVSFDTGLTALTTPHTWGSWGLPPDTESALPRVLWTNGLTAVEITFSSPVFIFGVEGQPNTLAVSSITAEYFSGAASLGAITLDVDGDGGARLFAASSDIAFDRVVLNSTDDFAIAQVRLSAVPEPAAAVGVLIGLTLVAASRWRRREQ